MDSYEKFLDKELSWLRFNQRVLEQAEDSRLPLLERVKFLSIFTSNLDEFFMKRVGGLKRQLMSKIDVVSFEGKTPAEQIAQLRSEILPSLDRADRLFKNTILRELKEQGVRLFDFNELSSAEKEYCTSYFESRVFPLLTPYAVDAGHPFPMISNLSTSMGVLLRGAEDEELEFVRIKISHVKEQWVELPSDNGEKHYVSLASLVKAHLHLLFPHFQIEACLEFRVTRNADFDLGSDEDAEDLLERIEQELRQRRFAQAVRLEYPEDANQWVLNFLMDKLGLDETDIYTRTGLLNYRSLGILQKLPLNDCKLPDWHPVTSQLLAEETSLFSVLKYRDLLFHHPYESFQDSTLRLLREAAEDPKVRSIKLTLYRVGDHSPLIPLLVQATEWGVDVVCMVELQARFDEERNIQWANTLEEAGVHVVYGIPGLKTHAKVLLIVREEGEQLKTYAHVGTGNYNHFTANLYTDFGYMTAKEHITTQLHHLFNYITGRSLKSDYAPLLVAPMNMKKRFMELIEHEVVLAKAGEPAEIIAKMNGLDDEDIIESLYNASSHGVKITLIVRGICRLRPQVKGLSDNIEVISILDRFLEHSRVYYFRHGAKEETGGLLLIGSADWMRRNLHRRVELIVPLEDSALKNKALLELEACRKDNKQAWLLQPNGTYIRKIKRPSESNKPLSAQEFIMNSTLEEIQAEQN